MLKKIILIISVIALIVAMPALCQGGWGAPPRSQLAAEELDKLWDEWMDSMSQSYQQTLSLLENKENTKAAEKFSAQFVPAVKKLYSEAASVYPTRFEKIDDWCAWTRNLYILTRKTETAFDDEEYQNAEQTLKNLRNHIYELHEKTETMKSNDFLYTFRMQLQKENVETAKLKDILENLQKAPLSNKAKENTEAFQQKLNQFSQEVKTALEDNSLSAEEKTKLENAADEFYKNYGIQFE